MEHQPKKVFSSPELRIYGDISRITQAVGNSGTADGGIAPNHKTQA
jgi:hypothetical protein